MSNAAASPGVLGSRAYICCTNSGLMDGTMEPSRALSDLPAKAGGDQGSLGLEPWGGLTLSTDHRSSWFSEDLGCILPREHPTCPPQHSAWLEAHTHASAWGANPTLDIWSGLQFEQDIIRKRESVWQGCWGRSSLIVR